jgi:hypothetical protein
MKHFICVVLLCGCAGKQFQVETVVPDAFTVTVQSIAVKQDHSITMLSEINSRVGDLLLASDDTKQRLETMEASLVSTKTKSEEVIKSALEPQETARANQSQSHQPVAWSPAVRLFVTSSDSCAPCVRLWEAVAEGKFDGFEVVTSPDFEGLRSYPAIRFRDPASVTGWSVRYGYDDSQLQWLRNNLLQTTGGEPLTGSLFQNHRASGITSQRTSVRSLPRRSRFVGRSNYSTRQSCPSGGCPR